MAAISMNTEQFQAALESGKPLLVDYWAPWCGYCRRIAQAYDRIALEYGEQVTVVKINIDEEPQLANREQIEVIPTLVLYRNGKAVDSIVAPESKARIGAFLEEALNK